MFISFLPILHIKIVQPDSTHIIKMQTQVNLNHQRPPQKKSRNPKNKERHLEEGHWDEQHRKTQNSGEKKGGNWRWALKNYSKTAAHGCEKAPEFERKREK